MERPKQNDSKEYIKTLEKANERLVNALYEIVGTCPNDMFGMDFKCDYCCNELTIDEQSKLCWKLWSMRETNETTRKN